MKPGASRELNVSSGASRPLPGPIQPAVKPSPAFAHASEAEFARILDFYAVRWEYEPHTFPILWNLDGAVVESFSPDFWLPDLETYVELTTLKQSLVRKKNRKLRRLRELYPDVRIKLFYGRDFRALMLKYGKLGLIGEMSGTLGQSTPTGRAVALLVAASAADPADLVVAAEAIEAADAIEASLPPAADARATGDASAIASASSATEPAAAGVTDTSSAGLADRSEAGPLAEGDGTQGAATSASRRRRRHRRRQAGDRPAGTGMIGRDRRVAGDR